MSEPLLSSEANLYKLSDSGESLHVLTPDTPARWKNYFFNDEYYLDIDQCGQGDAQMFDGPRRKTTGAYRWFFLKDEATGEVWNLTVRPLNVPLDSFEAVQHITHSEFNGSKNAIASAVKAFVPTEGTRELWTIALTNHDDRERTLTLYSVIPFEDGGLMNAKGWYDAEKQVGYGYFFPYHTTYDEKALLENRKTLSYLFATVAPDSADSNQRKFFGSDDIHRMPAAIARGTCSGQPCNSEVPVGAFQHKITLGAGETFDLGLCAGLENQESAVHELQSRYTSAAAIDAELDAVKAKWNGINGDIRIQTPDTVLDGFFNTWLKKQIVFQSRLNRLCFEFPIRNQLQDYMGYSLIEPSEAFKFIATRFGLQNQDGYLNQWWTEGDKDNHRLCALDFKDGGIWLILCGIIVARQNGSTDLYTNEYGFFDGEDRSSGFDHMMRAVRCLADKRGAHGLCLLGEGDWTDPINGPGRNDKGESTWTTTALGFAAQMLAEVAEELSKTDEAAELRKLDKELHEAVHTHCWNGEWFVTGFDDDGKSFGNPDEEEGKIFVNSQTWTIMAGYVSEDRMEKTVATIRRLETRAGCQLCWPAFSKWNPVWGRISLKLAGTSENGSIYCHAGMFKAYADCVIGDGDKALEEIIGVMPANAKNPPSHNTQGPIYVPNYYFGLQESPDFGVSSRNHRTGTAPWMLGVMIEQIFGVRATGKGLEVKPNLPSTWDEASIMRVYRGSTYDIAFKRVDGESRITVDGEVIDNAVLPNGAEAYQVVVEIGG